MAACPEKIPLTQIDYEDSSTLWRNFCSKIRARERVALTYIIFLEHNRRFSRLPGGGSRSL
jgi:hypothetical protein